jgi:uncharacterized protein (DUF736 family)
MGARIGVAWNKKSEQTGEAYLSVSLDFGVAGNLFGAVLSTRRDEAKRTERSPTHFATADKVTFGNLWEGHKTVDGKTVTYYTGILDLHKLDRAETSKRWRVAVQRPEDSRRVLIHPVKQKKSENSPDYFIVESESAGDAQASEVEETETAAADTRVGS